MALFLDCHVTVGFVAAKRGYHLGLRGRHVQKVKIQFRRMACDFGFARLLYGWNIRKYTFMVKKVRKIENWTTLSELNET